MHKYARLLTEIEQRIEAGEWKDGERLPSIREFAKTHHVSNSTVIAAYAELERRHLIYAIPKSGYRVVKQTRERQPDHHAPLDFASASPDPAVFPYLDFQHCINKAIDTYQNDLFTYGTASGLPSLVAALPSFLADDQVFTKPQRIAITSGVQQALSLLVTMPFPNKKQTVLIEQPSYHLLIKLLAMYNIPVIGIERTADGIDLDELERIFQKEPIKFFYTMPRFHNPLGTSLSAKQKKAIVELARAYEVYLVEDDYVADFETDAKVDPMYAYSPNDTVIYLKSYSKILFPGLRVGVAVLPEELCEIFATHKQLHDIDSSMLSQAALEIYYKSGMFARHKEKIRSSYSNRSERLREALAAQALDGAINMPLPHFVHTCLSLETAGAVSAAIQRLRKRGVIASSADECFLAAGSSKPLLRLNVSRVPEEAIARGVEEIFAVLGNKR